MQNKKSSLKYAFVLLITAAIWGFAFVAQVESDLGVCWFNGIRFLLGAVSLIPVILIFDRKKPDKAEILATLKWGAIAGSVLFGASTLQMWGISLTKSSGKAGFITGFYMVLVPVFAAVIGRARLTFRACAGSLVALAGLFFISFSGGTEKLEYGDLAVLAGAFVWAVHILTIDSVPKNVSALKFSAVQFFTVGVISLIVAPILESDVVISLSTFTDNLIPILFCGIMSCGVAYTGQTIGQRGCEPGLATIIMSLESVFSAIGGVLFLGENLGFRGYLGCVLMFIGILIVQDCSDGKKDVRKKAEE